MAGAFGADVGVELVHRDVGVPVLRRSGRDVGQAARTVAEALQRLRNQLRLAVHPQHLGCLAYQRPRAAANRQTASVSGLCTMYSTEPGAMACRVKVSSPKVHESRAETSNRLWRIREQRVE